MRLMFKMSRFFGESRCAFGAQKTDLMPKCLTIRLFDTLFYPVDNDPKN